MSSIDAGEKMNPTGIDERDAEKSMNDAEVALSSFKFLKALLGDYNACKTDLARSGIFNAIEVLVGKLEELHSSCLDAARYYKAELDVAKAKIPKTKEEIARILSEVGFHELEEVKDVYCHAPKLPPLTPKAYAELYKKYYDDQHSAVDGELVKLDGKDNRGDEFSKIKKACDKTLAKIAAEELASEPSESKEQNLPRRVKKKSNKNASKQTT